MAIAYICTCCRKANFLKGLVPWMADPKLPAEARDRWVDIWSRADSTLGTEVMLVACPPCLYRCKTPCCAALCIDWGSDVDWCVCR